MNEDVERQVDAEVELLSEIRKKMRIFEKWTAEDARAIHQKIRAQHSEEQPPNKNKKPTYDGKKYDFSEAQGHATNKQLDFIQGLRKKAGEGDMSISVTVDNVLKLTLEEADNEIKRLKEKLNWKDREAPAK